MAVKSPAGEKLDTQPARRRISSVRAFVAAMLASRSRLEAPGSPLGGMLDRASTDVDGSAFRRDDADLFRATHVADDRMHRHALYALVWSALTLEEQAVLELKHTPKRFVSLHAERRLCDVREGDGAELLSLKRDVEGELTGVGVFKELEAVMLTDEEIAEVMFVGWRGRVFGAAEEDRIVPLSVSQVRARVKSAHGKIVGHAVFRQMRDGY